MPSQPLCSRLSPLSAVIGAAMLLQSSAALPAFGVLEQPGAVTALFAPIAPAALIAHRPAQQLAQSQTARTARARSRLERNPVQQGESLRLVIEVAATNIRRGPDLSLLERDFEVLSSATNTTLNFIGGKQQASTQWLIELLPKRSGVLQIPVFTIDKLRTKALTLRVLKAQSVPLKGRDIFLEVSVSPAEGYVQQQRIYTVRLYHGVNIIEGNLSEPAADGLEVRRLGGDRSYRKLVNGRRYGVIERQYAIFPQQSGSFTIQPLVFQGRVSAADQQRSTLNLLLRRGRTHKLEGAPKALSAVPPPQAFTGADWLPARALSLHDSWDEASPSMSVGVPLTRHIRIAAKGVLAEQIPALDMTLPYPLRSYADKPSRSTRSDNQQMIAEVKQTIAIVPQAAGRIRVPPLRLPWWDVAQQRMRVATLPARDITVAAAARAQGIAAGVSTLSSAGDERAVDSAVALLNHGGWLLLSVLLALGWGLTGACWWRYAAARAALVKRQQSLQQVAPGRRECSKIQRDLVAACQRNDPHGAHAALIKWGQAAWPDDPPVGPLALAARFKAAALEAAVRELEQRRYAIDAHASALKAWRGAALLKAVNASLRPPPASCVTPRQATLTPLVRLQPAWQQLDLAIAERHEPH